MIAASFFCKSLINRKLVFVLGYLDVDFVKRMLKNVTGEINVVGEEKFNNNFWWIFMGILRLSDVCVTILPRLSPNIRQGWCA